MENSVALAPASDQPAADAPIFVVTASRSGSTLLRFLLDSHPQLACPPETGIASACAGLVRSLDILENAGAGTGRPANEPVKLSNAIAAVIRDAVDDAFGSYLKRRERQRWCDKSLDTFQFAGLLAEIYPQAQFICLYRHCMDVIASGVEACPWGLSRFGFDPHVAQHPGNSVAAVGSYWANCVQAILAFEERFPGRCLRVRYEDMVTAPEDEASRIFSFLNVAQVPGITEICFRSEHEASGPGDEKIWFTSGMNADSLGRGVVVPVAALPRPLWQPVNDALGKLGYRLIDEHWNDSLEQADPRARLSADTAVGSNGRAPEPPAAEPLAVPEVTKVVESLATRIRSHDEAVPNEVTSRWPALSGATIDLIVQAVGSDQTLRLAFPADGSSWTIDTGTADGLEATAKIMGSHETWQSLLDGRANPVTELTSGRLRCVNRRDAHRIRSEEMHAVAALLGIARIPVAH